MPKSTRLQRVADLIHHQLADLLKKEVQDSRLNNVVLTAVIMSPDLKQAKVFYTILETKHRNKIQQALNKAAGYLRHLLAEATVLRYIPQLQFIYDESVERGSRITTLIDDALASDRKLHKANQDEK